MKCKMILLLIFICQLFSTIAYAEPQNFYIPSGAKITNENQIVSGYCLEHNKEIITNQNINQLTKTEGIVFVKEKKNKKEKKYKFDVAISKKIIILQGLGSGQFIRCKLANNIEYVRIGNEGVKLFRNTVGTEDYNKSNKNIEIICDFTTKNLPQHEIQDFIWKNYQPIVNVKDDCTEIDFQSYEKGKELSTYYTNQSSIQHKLGKTLFWIDGIMKKNEKYIKSNNDLSICFNTHNDSDHVEFDYFLDKIIKKEIQLVIFPNPNEDSSKYKIIKNKIEPTLQNNEYLLMRKNNITWASSINLSMPEIQKIGSIHHQYLPLVDPKTKIPMNLNIIRREINDSSENHNAIIYRLTKGSVNQIYFGDFDDIDSLVEMAKISKENYRKRLELIKLKTEYDRKSFIDKDFKNIANQNIQQIVIELNRLWTIRANVMKWFHHSHVFKDSDIPKVLEVLEEINPSYILYDRHYTQNPEKFLKFINKLGKFKNRFIDIEKKEVRTLSNNIIYSYWRIMNS